MLKDCVNESFDLGVWIRISSKARKAENPKLNCNRFSVILKNFNYLQKLKLSTSNDTIQWLRVI